MIPVHAQPGQGRQAAAPRALVGGPAVRTSRHRQTAPALPQHVVAARVALIGARVRVGPRVVRAVEWLAGVMLRLVTRTLHDANGLPDLAGRRRVAVVLLGLAATLVDDLAVAGDCHLLFRDDRGLDAQRGLQADWYPVVGFFFGGQKNECLVLRRGGLLGFGFWFGWREIFFRALDSWRSWSVREYVLGGMNCLLDGSFESSVFA